MSARFCLQCGTRSVPGAKFCAECGSDLRTGVARADAAVAQGAQTAWQITTPGISLLGVLLVAGLAIWASILSPEPPKAALGGRASAPSPQAQAAPGGGEAPPQRPLELPAEVKKFMTELATKAQSAPDDAAAWNRLGQVYYRAAQLDPSYYPKALDAFDHVLQRDPKSKDAIRGKANVFYDRQDHAQAIPLYEQFLVLEPGDPSALTDLATMYLYGGDPPKAIAMYEDVIAKNPTFLQAHYNLAVTYAQLGDNDKALASFKAARALAPDDNVRKQIDDMTARISGAGGAPTLPAAVADAAPLTPFQSAVEKDFRGAPIMGERIARIDWSSPTTGRVLVKNFPMDGMPPEVREKFATRLRDSLQAAVKANQPKGDVRMEIADAGAGNVMLTVTPAGIAEGGADATPPPDAAPLTPFQSAVEKDFRGAPIMGERIARIEWSNPTTGRVLVKNFPMDGMPPEVREKFATRLRESLQAAVKANQPTGDVRMEIADAGAGNVMLTVTP
ncbi:MAG TPA: tetratricopeptide repeat protein [Candidatus Binatia bacterium]|jgi:tetratricopeptide (TPR) repeat protein|nr:tetratricopeptide repeat protein [Candidatus Binatia bacterium]